MIITDDGKGFDIEKAMDFTTEIGGYGLLNMRERIVGAGGAFKVKSNGKKRGTTIEIKIKDTKK